MQITSSGRSPRFRHSRCIPKQHQAGSTRPPVLNEFPDDRSCASPVTMSSPAAASDIDILDLVRQSSIPQY
ncbi:hypothetical protein KP509_22G057200 [Ceratopteris richardii]|nr:hypothetical protein KP509_22G057200 [Ceratopteris richardii]